MAVASALTIGAGAEGRRPHALCVWGAWSAERAYAGLNEGAWEPWQ
jgi:hypothetical protein